MRSLARLLGWFIFWALWIGATYYYFPDDRLSGVGRWVLLILSSGAALQLALAFALPDVLPGDSGAKLAVGGCLTSILYVVVAVVHAIWFSRW